MIEKTRHGKKVVIHRQFNNRCTGWPTKNGKPLYFGNSQSDNIGKKTNGYISQEKQVKIIFKFEI